MGLQVRAGGLFVSGVRGNGRLRLLQKLHMGHVIDFYRFFSVTSDEKWSGSLCY
jgi:hypothetical protein